MSLSFYPSAHLFSSILILSLLILFPAVSNLNFSFLVSPPLLIFSFFSFPIAILVPRKLCPRIKFWSPSSVSAIMRLWPLGSSSEMWEEIPLVSCLLFSRLVLFCLELSFLEFSCPELLCWIALSCVLYCCVVLSCLVLSCLVLSCLVLSCLVLSCLVFCFIHVLNTVKELSHLSSFQSIFNPLLSIIFVS